MSEVDIERNESSLVSQQISNLERGQRRRITEILGLGVIAVASHIYAFNQDAFANEPNPQGAIAGLVGLGAAIAAGVRLSTYVGRQGQLQQLRQYNAENSTN